MNRYLILLYSVLLIPDCFANINHIDITKIGDNGDSKFVLAYHDIRFNQQLYDHWSAEWHYNKSKTDVMKTLREHYTLFSSIGTKNTELHLLLGDISHYLYNLDDSAYYRIAVSHYAAAATQSPGDFRCYWFQANHYALSNVPVKAFDNFQKAEKLLPVNQPADFWNEYAMSAALSNMPSHSIFAMDQAKKILGKESMFEARVGTEIRNRIIAVDKKKDYPKEEIWGASQGEKVLFLSRQLGIKILVDADWKVMPYDYQRQQSVFIIEPTPIAGERGKTISYTVAVMMKTANADDKLSDHMKLFMSQYPAGKKVTFSDKYGKMEAYEIRDKNTYADKGGAHSYIIGIERTMPAYPGLLLENPVVLPKENAGGVYYYKAAESKNRFEGKIFYTFIFDSCEDIYEESFAVFKDLFEYQVVIE